MTSPQASSARESTLGGWRDWIWLGFAIFLLLIAEIRAAALCPLWFDELSTLYVATTPSLRQMFQAVPADGHPPLYFLLARLCLHLPVSTELALRLPSIVAINIAALMVYLFVRRDAGSRFGLLAVSVFVASTFGRIAATEARPYALLLCFTAIAVYCWQIRTKYSRLALVGVASAMAGAIFSHHYGVVYVSFPLFCGEAVRTWRRRRIDLPMLAAMVTGWIALIFTIPPMLRGQADLLHAVRESAVFWARPHWSHLALYADTVPTFIPILLIPAISMGLLAVRRTAPTSPPLDDLAVVTGLALLLPGILILTEVGTGYFRDRYAVGAALGVAMLCGLLLSRVHQSIVSGAITYCLLTAFLGTWIAGPRQTFGGNQSDPVFQSAPVDMPLVIADALKFPPTWWYSDKATRARLHYLSDLDEAVKHPDFLPEYSLALERPFGAPRLDNYHKFLASHSEFLLFCDGTPRLEWVQIRLAKDGWKLVPLRSEKSSVLYRVTRGDKSYATNVYAPPPPDAAPSTTKWLHERLSP